MIWFCDVTSEVVKTQPQPFRSATINDQFILRFRIAEPRGTPRYRGPIAVFDLVAESSGSTVGGRPSRRLLETVKPPPRRLYVVGRLGRPVILSSVPESNIASRPRTSPEFVGDRLPPPSAFRRSPLPRFALAALRCRCTPLYSKMVCVIFGCYAPCLVSGDVNGF